MKDNEVTNSDGRTSQAFSKDYDYLEDINCIYSEEYPEGKMLDLIHIKLYCRFKRYQNNGAKCYESQGLLGKICRCDPGTIGDKVKELVKMGLVRTNPNPDPRYDTLVYTALPLTDAHVIPPDMQQEASKQAPAPTMTKVIEEAVIMADSVPESVATTTGSDPAVIDAEVAIETVCELLSKPESLRQNQRYDTFTAYARRVLNSDGRRISRKNEERLEERFEQLYPHLYSRFEISF